MGRAAKAMLRVKGALDAYRLKPVPCDGYVDNDALRLAVQRGSSAKLGHLRVHAGTCFRLLAQLPISLHRVGTAENEADIMTKVLSAVRHPEISKIDFDLDAVPEASVMPHAAVCRHAGWRSLGSPEDDRTTKAPEPTGRAACCPLRVCQPTAPYGARLARSSAPGRRAGMRSLRSDQPRARTVYCAVGVYPTVRNLTISNNWR